MRFIIAVLLVMTLAVSSAEATLFTADGDTSDRTIGLNLSGNPTLNFTGDTQLRTGGNNYTFSQGDLAAFFVFQLPNLGGESILSADLSFDGVNQFETVWNVDLYGVRSAATNSVILGDYGYGASPAGTLIQDNIMTPADTPFNTFISKSTNPSGDSALASWLVDQYSAVGVGGFVFFRLNSDDPTTQPAGDPNVYRFAPADSTTQATPVLSITTLTAVPEVSSAIAIPFALAIAGFGTMLRRRWQPCAVRAKASL